ncbi:CocE/NonD family hydrolase [Aquimarina algiphila]|uniref:CocE/NonD family hydrolase n=1 Tax=Aquimarina algiphila TaxID=2047982 RepID=UPI002493B456|nr:CocE/NonD family hydrolase [Aquimarina algiphila]
MLQSTLKFLIITVFIFLASNCTYEDDLTGNPIPPIEYKMLIENDVQIKMRDGIFLSANVYRPDAEGQFPVIMSLGPYGKDDLPAEYDPQDDGNVQVSEYAAFETPDPAYWVKNGYVVIAVDSRGTGKSPGTVVLLESGEAQDFYDAIEWAGVQNWSSGKVGLNGVSYFGLSQWRVAAMNPPHLKAIMPYEGFTDIYRDATYHGGISSTFIDLWFNYRILSNLSSENTGYRHLQNEINKNPLSTAQVYQDLDLGSTLSQIKVPAYVAVSIQDHGLHTRGTINGFQKIGSPNKWLELFGRKKWEYYYSEDATSRQKMFFDQFLKDEDSGILNQAPIRYELREAFYKGSVKTASEWPILGRELTKMYLNAETMTMSTHPNTNENTTSYDATVIEEPELITEKQRVIFKYHFNEDTDIVGSIKLNLFVSSDIADDIDLFVGIQKENTIGEIIHFQGPAEEKGQIASGWLRVSHRALDKNKSTVEIPFHTHDHIQKISPNEIVEVQVEIWPTTVKFKSGEILRLVIQGNDIVESQEEHKGILNKGNTTIYTGGKYKSYLQIPVLE